MIGTGYAAGGGGRLFSRAPKSLAVVAAWRRRRRHKNTAPRISATPRRPPITPPTITPLLPPLDEGRGRSALDIRTVGAARVVELLGMEFAVLLVLNVLSGVDSGGPDGGGSTAVGGGSPVDEIGEARGQPGVPGIHELGKHQTLSQ